MKNREFTPFVGFGDIKFGAKCADVRALLEDEPYEQVFFNKGDKKFCDHFDTLGFKVEYDDDLTVLGIETFNDFGFPFKFMGKNLTLMSYTILERFFKKIDPKVEPFSIGFYAPSWGISVCFSDFEDYPDEPTDSFHIIRKDYMEVMK
jgi:hypothetical protein